MHIIRKTDMILIASFLFCAFVLIFILFFAHLGSANGEVVVVSVDGVEYLVIDLHENEGRHFEIRSERGLNIILIENQSVRMLWADCPDELCVHQVPIGWGFQAIVCLPNRVVVELRGVGESGVDGVVR